MSPLGTRTALASLRGVSRTFGEGATVVYALQDVGREPAGNELAHRDRWAALAVAGVVGFAGGLMTALVIPRDRRHPSLGSAAPARDAGRGG